MRVFRAEVQFMVDAVFEVVAEDEGAALDALGGVSTDEWKRAINLALIANTYDVVEENVDFEDLGEASEGHRSRVVRAILP